MKTIHLGISTAYAPRKPEAVASSVVVVKGSRASTISNAVVQPGVRFKAVPVLFVAKFIIDVINGVYSILLLRSYQWLPRDES